MDERLVEEFCRIAGPENVLREPIKLLTYECDALPHLRADARARRAARVSGRGPGSRALVRQGRRAVRGARARHRSLRRSAAGSGWRGHRAQPAQPRPRHRHSEPSRDGRARRHEPRDHETRRAVRLLLRAGSLESAGVLDRRQRRRELGRRALPEVRVHDPPRARGRLRPAGRRAGARSAARWSTRPGPT